MDTRSLYYQVRQIEMVTRRIQSNPEASRPEQTALQHMQKRAGLAVAAIRDYENFTLEEDTKAQLRSLPRAVKSLEQLRESILKASEYDLIGAVDVGMLTAGLDELIARLQ